MTLVEKYYYYQKQRSIAMFEEENEEKADEYSKKVDECMEKFTKSDWEELIKQTGNVHAKIAFSKRKDKARD